MEKNDKPYFLKTDDPDALPVEDQKKYLDYWFQRTPGERLRESWRSTCAKYGISPDQRMDKTRLEIINLSKYNDR